MKTRTLATGPRARGFGPEEEASIGDDLVAGLESVQHRHEFAHRSPDLHRTLDELAFLPIYRNVNNRAVAQRLDGSTGHDRDPLGRAGLEAHGDEHAEAEVAAAVRHLDAHF